MTKFTQGNWEIIPTLYTYPNEDDIQRGYWVYELVLLSTEDEARANANLIETAPDLLKALKDSNSYIDTYIKLLQSKIETHEASGFKPKGLEHLKNLTLSRIETNKAIIEKAEKGEE